MAAGDVVHWTPDITTVPGAISARGRRTTTSTASTGAEVGVMRLDNVPVRSGHVYHVMTGGVNLDTSINNDSVQVRWRVAQAAAPGTVATTASTSIGLLRNVIDDNGSPNVQPGSVFYIAAADGYASFLLTVQRFAGTGSEVILCSNDPLDQFIFDLGDDPGDTAVIL